MADAMTMGKCSIIEYHASESNQFKVGIYNIRISLYTADLGVYPHNIPANNMFDLVSECNMGMQSGTIHYLSHSRWSGSQEPFIT